MDLRLMDVNPARLVKNLTEKSGERQVYIGFVRSLETSRDREGSQ